MPNLSSFFKLNSKDLVKGLIVAVVTVILGSLQQGLSAHGFDFGTYDWAAILDAAWKAAGAYLAKNLLTDEEGTVHLGVAKIKA